MVVAAVGIYLFFALRYLELPGLEYDETVFVNAAMGNLDGTFVDWQIEVAGKHIPLMLMRYIGALKAYLYAPIFALFGPSVTSVRLPVVLIGLVTLFFTCKLVRGMLGEKVALLTLILVASDPAFIFINRLDWGPVSLMMVLKMASLYLLWRWLIDGNPYLLGLAAFLLGLGLFDKVIFIWFLSALALAFPLCFWRKIKTRLSWPAILLALVFFLLGCWPLIAYNTKFPWRSFEHQRTVSRMSIESLRHRYHLFRQTLDGSAVHSLLTTNRPGEFAQSLKETSGDRLDSYVAGLFRLIPLEQTLNWYALIVALAILAPLLFLGRLEAKGSVSFFVLLSFLITASICATSQGTGPHHTIMVVPFTHILIASVVCGLSRVGRNLRVTRVAGFVVLPLLLLPQILLDAAYLRSFRLKGGVGIWSDAIYQLADYAKENSDKPFLLMDWGFSNQLLLLTRGRIKKEEAFLAVVYRSTLKEKLAAIYPYLEQAESLLVFHARRYEAFPMLAVLRAALATYGLEAKGIKIFHQRDGQPVYLIYQVVPPGWGALDPDVLGYVDRPEVRLEVTPAEVVAGRDSLSIRAVNFNVPAIDLVYSFEGQGMPPLYSWPLDQNGTSTVFWHPWNPESPCNDNALLAYRR